MKNSMENFGEFALNRSEMKEIVGSAWGTWCRYTCQFTGKGGASYSGSGWSSSSPSASVGQRLPGTGASTGLVCVIFECSYRQI